MPVSAAGAVRPLTVLVCALLAAGCLGGPHPLPPEQQASRAAGVPSGTLPSMAGQQPKASLDASGTGANSQPGATSAAGAAAPPTANGAAQSTPTTTGAAGSGAPGAGPGAASPAAGSSATTGTSEAGDAGCQSQRSLPSALGESPDTALLLMDRSAGMANDFEGTPRWQVTGQALRSALSPLTKRSVQVGAMFYPSAPAASSCNLPAWLCTDAGVATSQTCGVNPITADDQIDFAPMPAVLDALSASPMLNAPVSGMGVPVAETLDQASSALASKADSGTTTVVLLVNAGPSCRWDPAQAASTIAAWQSQGDASVHVIALPGAQSQDMAAFSALADAAGSRLVAPANASALSSALQSVLLGSLSSCTLALDPPVTDAAAAHVIVGEDGVEREVPRTSDSGEALWSLSADGSQLMLLGPVCSAAQAGDLDSLRVAVGCVRYPLASF